MRISLWGFLVAVGTTCAGYAAECGCGYPSRRPTPCPSCCEHICVPTPEPPAAPEAPQSPGAFAAPPRSGIVSGATRSLGLDGGGLHFPAMSLRLPTLQLPGLVRYSAPAKMLLEPAVAPHTLQVQQQFGVDAPNTTLQPPNAPVEPPNAPGCTQPSCVNEVGMLPYARPAAIPHPTIEAASPQPPVPQAVRPAERPDLGTYSPSQQQFVQDPRTGQIYQITIQALPTVQVAAPMMQPAAAPPVAYQPGGQPVAAHDQALLADLAAAEQRARQLEVEVQRMSSLVQQMSVPVAAAPQSVQSVTYLAPQPTAYAQPTAYVQPPVYNDVPIVNANYTRLPQTNDAQQGLGGSAMHVFTRR